MQRCKLWRCSVYNQKDSRWKVSAAPVCQTFIGTLRTRRNLFLNSKVILLFLCECGGGISGCNVSLTLFKVFWGFLEKSSCYAGVLLCEVLQAKSTDWTLENNSKTNEAKGGSCIVSVYWVKVISDVVIRHIMFTHSCNTQFTTVLKWHHIILMDEVKTQVHIHPVTCKDTDLLRWDSWGFYSR